MELLSKDKLFFEQIIRDIYNKMDIVPEYIEKDYYALSILKELANIALN